MSSKNKAQAAYPFTNLLSNTDYLSFISIQAQYGLAQRGGTVLYTANPSHVSRIASDINLLDQKELTAIVFENFIGKN